jgi:L-lactate dehydrogenase (cytochrome)
MLSKVGWAYYASAGDDEISKLPSITWAGADEEAKNQNAEAYQKIHFRPRILRKVAEADARCTILGKDSSIPVFISPAYVPLALVVHG